MQVDRLSCVLLLLLKGTVPQLLPLKSVTVPDIIDVAWLNLRMLCGWHSLNGPGGLAESLALTRSAQPD